MTPVNLTKDASMRPRFMNRGSRRRVRRVCRGHHCASMRPRFMNRGSERPGASEIPRAPGFNEAPIHESGKSSRDRSSSASCDAASMRPRFMNRGSPDGYRRDMVAGIASMRPRFMNRGSERVGTWDVPVAASMRPRFMNRGSLNADITFSASYELQ